MDASQLCALRRCSGKCSTSSRQSLPTFQPACSRHSRGSENKNTRCKAIDQDLDWEPDLQRNRGLVAPGRTSSFPPPPPPKRPTAWWEAPFASRRNIALTMIGGSAGLWLINNKAGPIRFADKPTVPFKLLGFTDLSEDQFVYFKTAGGNWVAAAEDEAGRLFMVDEVGDLYYDSGDPDIGLYAMDTQGNLFNFYNDIGGERKITPVGNISNLKQFKINELAGVKLDRDVNVVAFQDGREIPLPPGTGYMDADGKFVPPGELVEGYARTRAEPGNIFTDLLTGNTDPSDLPPDRVELDLLDPTPFDRQMFDQVLLEDPTTGRPYLPDDFDLEALAEEVERKAKEGNNPFGKRPAIRR